MEIEGDDIASDLVIEGLRTGDNAVVREFCRRYGPALEQLARRRMSPALQRREGASDLVQSVYRTFFRRMDAGQFELGDGDALWRLLCAMTLTKVREKARFHGRLKRGMNREAATDEALEHVGDPTATTPEDATLFVALFEELLADLDPEQRRIVELKLEERTNEEIASEVGCSERTVRRLIQRLRGRLEASLADA